MGRHVTFGMAGELHERWVVVVDLYGRDVRIELLLEAESICLDALRGKGEERVFMTSVLGLVKY